MSISFDPEYDTPATLKAYADLRDFNPARWDFVTGDLADLTAFGNQFGEYFGHDGAGGINHNLRTVVVDARGRVQRIIQGNTWTSDELVAEILKAVAAK
jgi:protein SCO1/2